MDIILYKNKAPNNKVDKSNDLSNSMTIENVRFVDENYLDLKNPSILIKLSDEVSDIAKYNYCRIPKFNRFYYIVTSSTINGLVKIDCASDALMSFSKDIFASTQYVLRNQKYRSPYLVDNQIPMRSDKDIYQTVFGMNVDNKSCGRVILETTGKGGRII